MVTELKDLSLAHFISSAHLPQQWPEDIGVEVAFAGRSNVGKSSAINAITGQSRLARTSKTPGRTQQIVFFGIDDLRRIVDLPGYGYAKVPKELQRHWGKMVRLYLESRRSLKALILPIDIRRGVTNLDQQLLDWCNERKLSVHILLTKSDKLSRSNGKRALFDIDNEIKSKLVTVQLFSVTRKVGIVDARIRLLAWLKEPPSTMSIRPILTNSNVNSEGNE
ncbi:MAG: YihA family ribosome biogenesis GTP-binding protein [Acidiferrobacteraceae bacterium]|nr:YihA family ribosome biogenesis GTP-binding protein [Acidiferrobacteraceae bacterium]